MTRYDAEDLARMSRALEDETPENILRWAVGEFFPDLGLACSFGGPSGMVLVDMISRIEPAVEVFYLDTRFLFPEVYETRERVRERYGIEPVGYEPVLTPEEQAREYGDELWLRNPDLCCALRKVEPNGRALANKRAWVSGIRRDQGVGRHDAPAVEWDEKFQLVKVLPLIRWTESDVWSYIMKHDVPYNPLHDHNYPSIGCVQCTNMVKPGEDPRSGRWSGFDKTECGLHVPDERVEFARGEEVAG